MHTHFLNILSQLLERSKASVEIEDHVLQIERKEVDEWEFSMKLSVPLEKEILDCFSSQGAFLFSRGDVVLHYDRRNSNIYAKQVVRIPWKRYIPFKQSLDSFLDSVSEYESILGCDTIRKK